MQVNAATGEVTAEIGGTTFRLFASLEGMGGVEAALGVDNALAVIEALQRIDVKAIAAAMDAFCVSGNAALLRKMPFGRVAPQAVAALIVAIAAAMPEPDGRDEKKSADA